MSFLTRKVYLLGYIFLLNLYLNRYNYIVYSFRYNYIMYLIRYMTKNYQERTKNL